MIQKKNKDLRLVVNYKKLNEYIIEDPFIILNIAKLITDMGFNEIFLQIDLKNGFNQVPIDKQSCCMTRFMLLGQHWEYKRIPFGIKPGSKIFQRKIADILQNIKGIFI